MCKPLPVQVSRGETVVSYVDRDKTLCYQICKFFAERYAYHTDILKVDFLRGQTLVLKFCIRKKCKNITKNHLICVKHEEKISERG